jgi:hypothetical protein
MTPAPAIQVSTRLVTIARISASLTYPARFMAVRVVVVNHICQHPVALFNGGIAEHDSDDVALIVDADFHVFAPKSAGLPRACVEHSTI